MYLSWKIVINNKTWKKGKFCCYISEEPTLTTKIVSIQQLYPLTIQSSCLSICVIVYTRSLSICVIVYTRSLSICVIVYTRSLSICVIVYTRIHSRTSCGNVALMVIFFKLLILWYKSYSFAANSRTSKWPIALKRNLRDFELSGTNLRMNHILVRAIQGNDL
jgi:hypothetical protein